MRLFKKLVMVVLALLPIMSFLLFAVTNIGSTAGEPYKKFGTYKIVAGSVRGYKIYVEQDTLASEMIHTLTTGMSYDGTIVENGITYENYRTPSGSVVEVIAGFIYDMQGLGFSTPCLVAFLYIFYMVFVEIIMMLYELILFIPKKCRELFGG